VIASVTSWKDGKLDGLCSWYYESGVLKAEATFKDGKQDGISKWYYESGKLKAEANWQDGRLLSTTCYDENGTQVQCSES